MAKLHISEQYNEQVYEFYKEKLADRYPFSRNAQTDAKLDDFEEFFKKGGVLDRFNAQYIAPFAKLNLSMGKYELRNIDGSRLGFSSGFLDSMILAEEIKKRFFASKGDSLSSTLYFEPIELGKNLSGLIINYDTVLFAMNTDLLGAER